MLTTEWKLKDALKVSKMEGREQGVLEGRLEAQRDFVKNMYHV